MTNAWLPQKTMLEKFMENCTTDWYQAFPIKPRRPKKSKLYRAFRDLGARDGWECHYCGRKIIPVDTALDFVVGHGEYIEIREYESGPCYLFRLPGFIQNPTVDHVIPRCKGGTNDLNNLVLACHWCNTAKNRNDYDDFVQSMFNMLNELKDVVKHISTPCRQ